MFTAGNKTVILVVMWVWKHSCMYFVLQKCDNGSAHFNLVVSAKESDYLYTIQILRVSFDSFPVGWLN